MWARGSASCDCVRMCPASRPERSLNHTATVCIDAYGYWLAGWLVTPPPVSQPFRLMHVKARGASSIVTDSLRVSSWPITPREHSDPRLPTTRMEAGRSATMGMPSGRVRLVGWAGLDGGRMAYVYGCRCWTFRKFLPNASFCLGQAPRAARRQSRLTCPCHARLAAPRSAESCSRLLGGCGRASMWTR